MVMRNRFPHFNWISKSAISIKTLPFSAVILLISRILILQTPAKAEELDELYNKHCQAFVPAPKTVGNDLTPLYEEKEIQSLGFRQAHYEGGESLFNESAYVWDPESKYVSFSVFNALKTDQEGVFKISGRLRIRNRRYKVPIDQGGFRKPFKSTRLPKTMPMGGVFSALVDGFWSNVTHRACLIGTGHWYLFNDSARVVPLSVKFSYPRASTILTSLINGTVESIENENYFEPVLISGVYDGVYEYTRVEDAKKVCSVRKPDVLDRRIDVLKGNPAIVKDGSICGWYWLSMPIELEWSGACNGGDCSPFDESDRNLLPNSMYIPNLHCGSEGQVHGFFGFFGTRNPMSRYVLPKSVLIGEGQWDEEKGQLCMVACRIGGVGRKLTEEDCGISISMQFPVTTTVASRYLVVGQVQSDKKVNDPMFFKKFAFRGPVGLNGLVGAYRDFHLPNLQYKYTKLDQVKRQCGNFFMNRKRSLEKKPGRKYPDGNLSVDLGFDASIEGFDKHKRYVSVYPFTIGNSYDEVARTDTAYGGQLNVSYTLQFQTPSGYMLGGPSPASASAHEIHSISAEGIYDTQTGSLCMIGCRHVGSLLNGPDGNMDCEILIDVVYAPTNPKFFSTEHLRGKIKSLREEKDPLYFKPVKLYSNKVYRDQAGRSVWRKDLEIIMSLVSLSLAALFILAQLLYVRKHSNSLPFVSLLMLTVLTLGHMIPLVLNFEAFFMNQKDKNVFQSSRGWLEVNEVVVRVMTMAAFLLQLRLLQLAWTARHNAAGEKSAWFWEKKVLYLCLPLYALGGLIACFAHWFGQSNSVSVRFLQRNTHHSLWEDFRSYAGLILDGFLLPQILGNLFWDIRETILVPYFYIGTTLVRSVPHVYDAYRAIWYIPEYSSSYFYATPEWDFYSTSWDMVIPCVALLLALVVFLQQRFGGRCIIPRRFRDHLEYQKIPVVQLHDQDCI